MPKSICVASGCGVVIQRGPRCAKHTKPVKMAQHTDKRKGRATANERGYGHKWRKARLSYLKRHPLCVNCLSCSITTPSNEVDHIIRHSGDDDPLFWDRTNWQALCKSCHSKKTREEAHLYT